MNVSIVWRRLAPGMPAAFWQRVVEVADDPWVYSSARTPSVLIDKVGIA